jgi:hypothetical protein
MTTPATYPIHDTSAGPAVPSGTQDAKGHPWQEEKDIVLGVDEDQAIDGVDPVYAAKARVLNRAIMDIGMGRYQWQLFFCIGYGWSMDNMASLIHARLTTVAHCHLAHPSRRHK